MIETWPNMIFKSRIFFRFPRLLRLEHIAVEIFALSFYSHCKMEECFQIFFFDLCQHLYQNSWLFFHFKRKFNKTRFTWRKIYVGMKLEIVIGATALCFSKHSFSMMISKNLRSYSVKFTHGILEITRCVLGAD